MKHLIATGLALWLGTGSVAGATDPSRIEGRVPDRDGRGIEGVTVSPTGTGAAEQIRANSPGS